MSMNALRVLSLSAACGAGSWAGGAAQGLAAQEPASAPAPVLVWPASAAERAWAAVGPGTMPASSPELEFAARADWTAAATWSAWSAALLAAAGGGERAAAARAELCLFAQSRGRSDDAWAHFAAAGADGALLARLLPALFPGAIPADGGALAAIAPGGLPRPLADGAVLCPALPPPTLAGSDGRFAARKLRMEGLAIGEAIVAFEVRLEVEGVQIEIEHQAGEAAHFYVQIPEPADSEIRVEYVNWMRQDALGIPHLVHVEPGQEDPAILYGRALPRSVTWPGALPERLPRAVELHGILVLGPDEAEDPAGAALARGLATSLERVLALSVRSALAGASPPGEPAGLTIDLAEAARRDAQLDPILRAVERWVLERS